MYQANLRCSYTKQIRNYLINNIKLLSNTQATEKNTKFSDGITSILHFICAKPLRVQRTLNAKKELNEKIHLMQTTATCCTGLFVNNALLLQYK